MVILFVVCCVTLSVNAQDSTKHRTPKEEKEWIAKQSIRATDNLKQVGATDEQIEKLKPIMLATYNKNKEIRRNTSITEAEKESKLHEGTKAMNNKIKEILGEEKAKKFIALFFDKNRKK